MPLLEITGLNVTFAGMEGRAHTIRNLDLSIERGQRVALVGESGSGKSVTARTIMGLLPKNRVKIDGDIRFAGLELNDSTRKQLLGVRIAMVFQDPSSTLNPVFRIRDQLDAIARVAGHELDRDKTIELLRSMAITDPERVLNAYPFQLSGGMAQRVLLGAALMNKPELIIADEPATALDAEIQQRSLELLSAASRAQGTSVLLITHHMGLVRDFADIVHVMYAGEIVESAPVEMLLNSPAHPYTQLLVQSVPRLSADELPVGIDGEPPDYLNPPTGCRFQPRCPVAQRSCGEVISMKILNRDQHVRCVLPH